MGSRSENDIIYLYFDYVARGSINVKKLVVGLHSPLEDE
jgi:hypothetical protein